MLKRSELKSETTITLPAKPATLSPPSDLLCTTTDGYHAHYASATSEVKKLGDTKESDIVISDDSLDDDPLADNCERAAARIRYGNLLE